MDDIEQSDPSPPAGEEQALRPSRLDEFDGQDAVRDALRVAIDAARRRQEPLGHVLFYGQPGLGKTTLAHIIAQESNGVLKSVIAPAISRAGDLASALVTMNASDVLFIDEIHRLPAAVEEMLYGAMEDFRLDIMTGGAGRYAPVSIPLNKFTLVGATTRSGMLSQPFRDRFDLDLHLEPYGEAALARIVERSAAIMGIGLDPGVSVAIAKRSRGTPRIANKLLRRVRDESSNDGLTVATGDVAVRAFMRLGLDADGLDARDRSYLEFLARHARPVGLGTLAHFLGEDRRTVEEEIEPWLVRIGRIIRTERGRQVARPAQGLLFS